MFKVGTPTKTPIYIGLLDGAVIPIAKSFEYGVGEQDESRLPKEHIDFPAHILLVSHLLP